MAVDTKTLLAISRVSNLPTVWMNVLAAALLTGASGSPGAALAPSVVLLLMVALSASYCGGMVLNDFCDREWDAREQPFRPIPAGRITAAAAIRLAVVLLGAGVSLLLFTPHPSAVIAGLVLLAVIWAYDRWHKAAAWTVLLMAATRTLVYVVTAVAIAGTVPGLVWLAGIAQLVWTLLVTVVARHENQRGRRYSWPVIPWMIAGMALLDGAILALLVSTVWLPVGAAAMLLTRFGQRYVRGD